MRETSRQYFGDPELSDAGVSILQEIIIASGAKDSLEVMIENLADESLSKLDCQDISQQGKDILIELAHIAIKRSI